MELLAELINASSVQNWMEYGGYFVLFGLLFSCGLGLPLPEDIPLMLAGFLVYQGKMHLLPAAVVAWCGIIGGDCVLYHFGKKYGRNITRVPFIGKHVTDARIDKAERLFARYGLWVVGVGRMFAGIRAGMVVGAGTTRYNFVKFIIADGLAAIVSGGAFVAAGYFGAKVIGNPQQVIEAVKPYKLWVFGGLALVVTAVVLILWFRKKRQGATIGTATRVEKPFQSCSLGAAGGLPARACPGALAGKQPVAPEQQDGSSETATKGEEVTSK